MPDLWIEAPGWRLAAQRFVPAGPPCGVVMLGHAMMCDRRTLDRPKGEGLASTLAAHGLLVYTVDSRGHGESGPHAAEGGRWTYADIVEGDVPALIRFARSRHPELPLALAGHSLVGHAALYWLGLTPTAPVSAVLTFAAGTWLPRFEPSRARWALKRAALVGWRAASSLGYFPAKRLGLGTEDESGDYVADFGRWAREGTVRWRGRDYVDGLARVRPPVLGWVGDRDRLLCHPQAAAAFMAALPRHELRVVPGADHMSLVLDPRFRPQWDQAARWLVGRLSPALNAGPSPPS